jgi:transcriptional regulator with XRE-family HTH domain
MKQSPLALVEKSKGESAFGRLLHFWRKASGLSQEQLSGVLGVSTRHISFLETGRSKPSRMVVQTLGDIFELSARDRAYLLTSAGFAADQSVFDSPELAVWIRHAMRAGLEYSEPAPAFVQDIFGKLLAVNRAFLAFLLPRVAPQLFEGEVNLYDLLLDPRGLRPQLHNGVALASGVVLYIAMESLHSGESGGWELLQRLEAANAVPDNWEQLGRKLIHTSHYPLVLNSDRGLQHLTVYTDTLSSTSMLAKSRLLIGRIYRDDGEALLDPEEIAAVPDDHPLLFRDI